MPVPTPETSVLGGDLYSKVGDLLAQVDAEPVTGDEDDTGDDGEGTGDDAGKPETAGAKKEDDADGGDDEEGKDDAETWLAEHAPEHVREALKHAALRHADYTRKTQALAAERRKLDTSLKEVDLLKEQYVQLAEASRGKAAPADKADKGEAEGPPEGASAAQVIQFYVDKAVKTALGDVNKTLADKLAPISGDLENTRALRAIETAYLQFATGEGADPIYQDKDVARAVGDAIAADQDLSDLALADPSRAVRMAAKLVARDREARLAASKEKAGKRGKLNGSTGTTTPAVRKSALDVAAEMLARMDGQRQ